MGAVEASHPTILGGPEISTSAASLKHRNRESCLGRDIQAGKNVILQHTRYVSASMKDSAWTQPLVLLRNNLVAFFFFFFLQLSVLVLPLPNLRAHQYMQTPQTGTMRGWKKIFLRFSFKPVFLSRKQMRNEIFRFIISWALERNTRSWWTRRKRQEKKKKNLQMAATLLPRYDVGCFYCSFYCCCCFFFLLILRRFVATALASSATIKVYCYFFYDRCYCCYIRRWLSCGMGWDE